MDCEEIELHVGYFKGMLEFMDGSILHFAEFVETYELVKRLKYKYHLQSESGDLIARWDNVPHHRDISTFPHHNVEYWEKQMKSYYKGSNSRQLIFIDTNISSFQMTL